MGNVYRTNNWYRVSNFVLHPNTLILEIHFPHEPFEVPSNLIQGPGVTISYFPTMSTEEIRKWNTPAVALPEQRNAFFLLRPAVPHAPVQLPRRFPSLLMASVHFCTGELSGLELRDATAPLPFPSCPGPVPSPVQPHVQCTPGCGPGLCRLGKVAICRGFT